MTSTYKTLQISHSEPSICVIHLHRPEAANALNTDMALEIKNFFDSITPNQYRAIILTGSGKHFCAGADLKQRKGIGEKEWLAQHHTFEQAQRAVLHCPLPVIAAVNGAAYGGGMELALTCDFIYASQLARFALTEAKLGIMPGMGGTQLLARAVGMPRAKELIFSAHTITAEEALQWGMVSMLCAQESLLDVTIACAKNIIANAPLSLKAIKQAMHEGSGLPLEAALDQELLHYNRLLKTKDRVEGINAFNEKRPANFKGE